MQPPPDAPALDVDVERRRIPVLLTGYWAFGQYWGIWVILVVQVQAFHHLSFGAMGMLLALLSLVAILVMAFVTPRLTRFPLGALCAAGLLALGTGSLGMALLPSRALWVAFAIAGVGNGLVDVFLNVEGQRIESITHRPVLQWLHATYAIGGITGAIVGGLVAATHTNFRVGLLFGALRAVPRRVLERSRRHDGAGSHRGRLRVLVDGVPPAPRSLAAGARRAVRVPRRGVDGHVVGSLSVRPARGIRIPGRARVRGVLGRDLPRPDVRRARAVRARAADDDHGLGRRRHAGRRDRRPGERPAHRSRSGSS